MRTSAITKTAMGIMDLFWPVNADTYNNLIALKAFTPGIVDQRGIGLHMLLNLNSLFLQLSCLLTQNGTSLIIKAAGQRQRFSCMPKD
jgi:hypothetical protein